MQILPLLPRLAAVVFGIALLTGCGSDTADVNGTVTMDGEPLPNATVIFTPQANDGGGGGGRPAAAVTDSQGYYELIYSRGATGAVPGEYVVEIRTYREANPDSESPEEQQGTAETVPAQYNADSELIKTVESGSNEINFDLSSEGEIKNPPGAGGAGYGGGSYGGGRY